MPRRRFGGKSTHAARRRAPQPGKSTHAARRHAPQPVHPAPAPAPAQSSSGGSVLGTIAGGMAFGAGMAMADRAVDAVMRPRTVRHETVVSQVVAAPAPPAYRVTGLDGCAWHAKVFQDCINNYGSDISKCQVYMDMLTECRRNSVHHAPPPAPVQMSSVGSMAEDRVVDVVMQPRTIQHETVVSQAVAAPAPAATRVSRTNACSWHSKIYENCIINHGNDWSKCQFYLGMLTECRRTSGSSTNL